MAVSGVIDRFWRTSIEILLAGTRRSKASLFADNSRGFEELFAQHLARVRLDAHHAPSHQSLPSVIVGNFHILRHAGDPTQSKSAIDR